MFRFFELSIVWISWSICENFNWLCLFTWLHDRILILRLFFQHVMCWFYDGLVFFIILFIFLRNWHWGWLLRDECLLVLHILLVSFVFSLIQNCRFIFFLTFHLLLLVINWLYWVLIHFNCSKELILCHMLILIIRTCSSSSSSN